MKTLATLLGAAVLTFSFSSCHLKEKYSKNDADTVAYISNRPPARMNIEGVWYSPQWGMVVLNQEAGGKLNGVFQDYYQVKGVVSGRDAYLALIDDDWTEYTVELHKISSEKLAGYYSPTVPFSKAHQSEVVLYRIDR